MVLTNEQFRHFEVDLIVRAEHKGTILTIVERKTKFLIMSKLVNKNAKSLAKSMIDALHPYKDYVKTITSDYCSWERGLSENTNGLVRQYIPK